MIPALLTTLACATCMSGSSEAEMAQTMAILFMLVVLAGVFAAIFRFMRYLWCCERNAGRRSQD